MIPAFILNPYRFAPAAGGGDAPTFQAATAAVADNTDVEVDFTGLVAAGDFLLIVSSSRADEGSATPSGWSVVAEEVSFGAGGLFSRMICFAKVAAGTETTVALGTTVNHLLAIGFVIRGADETTPINASDSDILFDAATGAVDLDSPTVTPSVANCLIIDVCVCGNDEQTLNSVTNSNLTGLTVRANVETSIAADSTIIVTTGVMETAAATGVTTFNITRDPAPNHPVAKFAIAPA